MLGVKGDGVPQRHAETPSSRGDSSACLCTSVVHDTAWGEPALRDDCVQSSLPCVVVGDGGSTTETAAAKEDRNPMMSWGKPLDCFVLRRHEGD